MNFYQSLYFINAHNNSMSAPVADEQHALIDNVSFNSNSTYSADEQVIVERGKKRKLSELDTNTVHERIQEDTCRSPKKIKRMKSSKSILRTPVKKRLKLMHDSKRRIKHRKLNDISSSSQKINQIFKETTRPDRTSIC